MAMAPVRVISNRVMIAMRMSAMRAFPMLSAKTSLGLGQGIVVEIRTFMYEVRKHVKMKVSLRRKIHIIALPQGTRNACLSSDQSDTTPGSPSGAEVGSLAGARAVSAAACRKLSSAEVDSPWAVRAFSDIGV